MQVLEEASINALMTALLAKCLGTGEATRVNTEEIVFHNEQRFNCSFDADRASRF